MKKNNKNFLRNNKGIVGGDIVAAIVIITIFAALITRLMFISYRLSVEMQKSSMATIYATIILEKVDEKAYEEIVPDADNTTNASGFIEKLTQKNPVTNESEITPIEEGYNIEMYVEEISYIEKDYIKQVTVKVTYKINNEEKIVQMSKLKVKELSNND